MTARSDSPSGPSGSAAEGGGETLAAVPDDLLHGLLDAEVRGAASAIEADFEALPAAERKLVARAVAGRRREFAQGRLLARRLLAEIGVPTELLLRDDDRVPRWPEGAVGCISHTKDLCAAVVAPAAGGGSGPIAGVGLDVEQATPLAPELRARICTHAERRFLDRGDEERAGALGKAFFSVKECVYKACFPVLRERWGFHDLEIELDPEAERFVATPLGGALARRALEGWVAKRGTWWIAGFSWRDAGLAGRPPEERERTSSS
ncbi:MAG TPA: 4'-phosphopantetheinyl transferase superfamily protein [Myxococcota bacterium]|nr:4'-phosphopantetheinyl transferase superfamily protein [Myxococcota bacterium]